MLKKLFLIPTLLLIFLFSGLAGAEEYEFEIPETEKQPFHLGGYGELRPVLFGLDRDAAFHKLNFFSRNEGNTLEEYNGKLQIEASYEKGIAKLFVRTNSDLSHSFQGWNHDTALYEGYLSLKPSSSLTIDLGKKTFKWGKGYAWNPVSFIDRPKDPDDPELALEGFIAASADYIKSFPGPLKTFSFTPVLLPVRRNINETFSEINGLNAGGRFYFLFYDTDIDFLFLTGKSKGNQAGIDFSRNLTTNFEVHGEFAFLNNQQRVTVDSTGRPSQTKFDAKSYLLGIRYLTESDTTYILEYYRNGTGFSRVEMKDFFSFIDRGFDLFRTTGNPGLLNGAAVLARGSYGRINPMKEYVYLRASQKEPFDILYFTPALTLITNLADRSFSLSPELLYTGITNLELRLKATAVVGQKHSEFGEKQNDYRIELRARYYFDAVKAFDWAKQKIKPRSTPAPIASARFSE